MLSIPVIARGQRPKPFLSGCVPDGQFYLNVVDLNDFGLEIYSDGQRLIFIEIVIREP